MVQFLLLPSKPRDFQCPPPFLICLTLYSGNVPYFSILLRLVPDNFTQGQNVDLPQVDLEQNVGSHSLLAFCSRSTCGKSRQNAATQ